VKPIKSAGVCQKKGGGGRGGSEIRLLDFDLFVVLFVLFLPLVFFRLWGHGVVI